MFKIIQIYGGVLFRHGQKLGERKGDTDVVDMSICADTDKSHCSTLSTATAYRMDEKGSGV